MSYLHQLLTEPEVYPYLFEDEFVKSRKTCGKRVFWPKVEEKIGALLYHVQKKAMCDYSVLEIIVERILDQNGIKVFDFLLEIIILEHRNVVLEFNAKMTVDKASVIKNVEFLSTILMNDKIRARFFNSRIPL